MNIDRFTIRQYMKWFRACPRVAFVTDSRFPVTYDKAWASIRTRCYDLMNEMERRGIEAELFRPFRKYDVVIFTKTCNERAYRISKKLKKLNIPFVMDAFCEFDDDLTRADEFERLTDMLKMSDAVICASEQQRDLFKEYNSDCTYIYEGLTPEIYSKRKKNSDKDCITIVWCGYSPKKDDLKTIKNVLRELIRSGGYELLVISDRDFDIEGFPHRFMKYDNKKIADYMCEGDVFVAPRSYTDITSRANSILRISIPMAVGLPVLGSPVPSYKATPINICSSDEEWRYYLSRYKESSHREESGKINRDFVIRNATIGSVCDRYLEVINRVTGLHK